MKNQYLHPLIHLKYPNLTSKPINQYQNYLFLPNTLSLFHNTNTKKSLPSITIKKKKTKTLLQNIYLILYYTFY